MRILLFIIILVCSPVFAGVTRPEIEDSKYVEYGEQFEHVQKVLFYKNDKLCSHASCIVLSPSWILTAAHVVYDTEDQEMIIGDKIKNNKVDLIIIHDKYDSRHYYNDIAVCRVKNEINLKKYPELYSERDELGKNMSMAGYGILIDPRIGFKETELADMESTPEKRAGTNYICATQDNILICDMSRNKPTELEFIISPGDSGGGLFINGKLAGINSYIRNYSKIKFVYGNEAAHTRVSSYKNWIEKAIESHKK